MGNCNDFSSTPLAVSSLWLQFSYFILHEATKSSQVGDDVSLFPMVLFLTSLIVHLTSGGLKPRKQRTENAGKEVGREDFCSLLVKMLTV